MHSCANVLQKLMHSEDTMYVFVGYIFLITLQIEKFNLSNCDISKVKINPNLYL